MDARTQTANGGFEDVYDAHFQPIFRYVLHRVADAAEAEDLTAQTFFKALKNLESFRPDRGSISSWLYRIATNEVADHFRRRSPTSRNGWSTLPSAAVRSELESADLTVARHRMFLAVNQALRTLAAQDQALVTLRYFEQKPFNEIAEILGKRPGALTMRLHRALAKLRGELERKGIDHEGLREVLGRAAQAGC